MFRNLRWGVILVLFALLATTAVTATVAQGGAQTASGGTAFLRLLQLANDGTVVSLTLQDGTTVWTNYAPGSVSDFITYDANRSSLVTLSIRAIGRQSYTREWAVPPLSPGHHTATVVGSGADNSLELVFIDEDTLCAGRLAAGSCLIMVNDLKGSPSLTVNANSTSIVDGVGYRQVVVGSVAAATYQDFAAVDQNNPQNAIFHLQRVFFEPNVIYIYSLRGSYPGNSPSNYTIGSVRRVAVDTMTFLRGLTATLQLTDTHTLFATENIVAILHSDGLDVLLANAQLPLTVFAPTDQAVLNIAPNLYQCVTTNPGAMRALILNHIILGAYSSAQLVNTARVTTMNGVTHTFRPTQGGFVIDNAVPVSDSLRYPTLNGSVYLIDTVLIPPGFADQYCVQG